MTVDSQRTPRGATFEATLRRLADPAAPAAPGLMAYLSDPRPEDVEVWRAVWAEMTRERRSWFARSLLEVAEADFQVSFKRLFVEMLQDDDPSVRALAVDGLWEAADVRLMRRFVSLLRTDEDPTVRARAAAALGTYVELGQLERIAATDARLALSALTDAAEDESEEPEVRRRATESAGYADFADVGAVIEAAIESDVPGMRAGALRAIGNSADDRWAPEVLAFLASPVAEIRFESARAAGELSLAGAVHGLVALVDDPDREVRMEAIWALGEIGGDVPRGILESLLAETDDPDLQEAVEDALASMTLSEGEMPWNDLLDASPDEWRDGDDEGDEGYDDDERWEEDDAREGLSDGAWQRSSRSDREEGGPNPR